MSCGTSDQVKCIYQGGDATFLSRVYRPSDGGLLTSAEISRIQQTIYNVKDTANPIDQVDLTIGSVFFDVLQLDGRWTLDTLGYNFAATIGGSKFTADVVRVEFMFFLSDGSNYPIPPFTLQVLPVYSANARSHLFEARMPKQSPGPLL